MNFKGGSDDEHATKLWVLKRFETQLLDIIRCLDFELEDEDLDFEVQLFNDPWFGKPTQTSKSYYKVLENFECCVTEVEYLLKDFSIKEMAEFHDRMLSRTYDALEAHPFFGKHASQALTIMSRCLPFKPEYYVSRIHETDADLDAQLLPRYLERKVFPAHVISKMCIALAKKHSFEGMEMAFQAWNRDVPIDNMYTSSKISLVWEMIIDSQAYTWQQLYPSMQKFIQHNLESFETILPMLGLGCKTPSPKLLLSMKQSGFEKIAQETGERVLHRHRDLFDNKYLDLEAAGVSISTPFLISTLNQEQGDAWRMAMAYYLDKDDVQLDLNELSMPFLVGTGTTNPDMRILRESNFLALLKTPGISEVARAKRQDLLSLFTEKDSYLMKRLIAKGLPESYLAMESVREEKLYMDLGL